MTTQLNELEKLQVKTKEYQIPRIPKDGEAQATIEFTALALDDLSMMDIDENTPAKEAVEKTLKAITKCMNTTREEVGKISFEHLTDIMDIFGEVNNFGEKEKAKMEKVKLMIAKKNGESTIKPQE